MAWSRSIKGAGGNPGVEVMAKPGRQIPTSGHEALSRYMDDNIHVIRSRPVHTCQTRSGRETVSRKNGKARHLRLRDTRGLQLDARITATVDIEKRGWPNVTRRLPASRPSAWNDSGNHTEKRHRRDGVLTLCRL